MDNLKQRAIDRALTILDNMGCTYRVLNEHGQLMANTIVAVPDDTSQRKKKRPLNKLMPYTAQVKAMAAGEALTFNVPEGFTASDVASAISASANYYHGKGACITETNAPVGYVTLLRVE